MGSGGDKIAHLLAYAVLMFWFMQIFTASPSRLVIATGLLLLGVGLEIVQVVLPFRTFELLDVASNAAGIGLGWVVAPPRAINVLVTIESLVGK